MNASVSSSMANTTIRPGIRADELDAERLGDAHHQARDQRADDVAERAEHDGDEGHQHEHLPDERIGRVERHQQRAGGAGERQRDAERDREHAVGVDAHQHRDVRFCAAARIALPRSVVCRKTQSAALSTIATTKAISFATGI